MLLTLVFVAPALHPIIYFAFNSEYRTGLTHAWKNLSCNQTPEQVSKARYRKVAYSSTSGLVAPFQVFTDSLIIMTNFTIKSSKCDW